MNLGSQPEDTHGSSVPVLWDPEVLSRVRHLGMKARAIVDGVLFGAHRSRAIGPNVEFADFKEYMPGDSLRDLDWKVFARSDRLVIRRYQAESDLASVIVLDASGDMATGSAGRARGPRPPIDSTKFGYALSLSATLATYLSLHGEPVGLLVLGGTDLPWRFLPPHGGRRHLSRILTVLASLRPGGRAEIGQNLAQLATRVRRSSLIALVSDLMEETESWIGALHALNQRRTDLRVFHLQDPDELNLRATRTSLFYSPEGGPSLPIDPVATREAFKVLVHSWKTEVRSAIIKHGALYLPTPTERALHEPLRDFIRG